MPRTVTCHAELTVAQTRDRALELFTPEGERAWAPGWGPSYPEPERTVGPGTVFVTAHGPHETTWVMVDHGEQGVRYARVTPGVAAGTVSVEALDSDGGSSRWRVTYDLTALSTHGEQWLHAFADGFEAEISEWEGQIAGSR